MPKSAGAEERVYLMRGRTVELPGGDRVIYPAGYYHLPPEQAAEWVRDGLAVPESEWEARLAQAAKEAAADPVMHLAGPREPALPATAPEGKMWPHGPKDSRTPAVKPTEQSGDQAEGAAPSSAPPAPAPTAIGETSADAQTSANEETR